MSINSCSERLDDAHEVQAILTSELSLETSHSFDLSLTFPANPDPSNPCMRSSRSSSLRHSPTVKFAPLPLPDPSRKRSVLPLGVATRSRRLRYVREATEPRQSLWANDPAADPLLEDPLIMWGKLVKSASKSLWRRIREGSGFVGQGQPMENLTDAILDSRSVEHQEHRMEVIPEHRQAVVDPEKQVGAPNNAKWQWRRSTGTMPSVPGLH
jgi:hypothetical protein